MTVQHTHIVKTLLTVLVFLLIITPAFGLAPYIWRADSNLYMDLIATGNFSGSNVSADFFTGDGSLLTNVAAGNYTFSVAAGNTSGSTEVTNALTVNITSVGNLPITLSGTTFLINASGLGSGTDTYNSTQDMRDAVNNSDVNVLGNAGTATALAANGANCDGDNLSAGVDASGAAEGCVDVVLEGEYTNLDTDSTDDFDGAWSSLSGVPAGFADDVDNDTDTTYTADDVGLNLTGTVFGINFPTDCSDEGETLLWSPSAGFSCGADAGAGGGMTSWTLSDGTSTTAIGDGERVNITAAAGGPITTSLSANDIIINSSADNYGSWFLNDTIYGESITVTSGSYVNIVASAAAGNILPFISGNELSLAIGGEEITTSLLNLTDITLSTFTNDAGFITNGIENNTAGWNLSLHVNTLYNGSTICTAANGLCADGTGTDDQTIGFNGSHITIEDGNSVDISSIDTDTDTQLTQEQVEDYAGGMDAGTETRISFTYNDGTGNFDIVVDDMNDDVPESGDFGNAADLESTGALSNDVVAAAEMADADHGDVSWSGGVATVEAASGDFAVTGNMTVGGFVNATDACLVYGPNGCALGQNSTHTCVNGC